MTQRNMLQWSFFIVLLGAWAHPLLAVNLQRMCIGRPFGTLLPNPLDCNSYYVCESELQLVYCDRGLHFDRVNKVCNWPRWANCRLDELETDAPTEQLSTSKVEEIKLIGNKSNNADVEEKEVPESNGIIHERDSHESAKDEKVSGNFIQSFDILPTEITVEESLSQSLKEPAESTSNTIQSNESEMPNELLNRTKVEGSQLEITELSDLKASNNSIPPSNSSKTVNVPVTIATGLLELKASNSSRPPANYSQDIKIVVELEEVSDLKVSNNSSPPSNTSQVAQKEVELPTELSDLKGPPSNFSQTLKIPVNIRPDLSELKASNNSRPPSNTSQVAQKEVELPTDLSDLKVFNTSRPPSNSSQTLKIPVNIKPQLSELKASNSSRPPSNYSQDVKITVELEELSSLKGSSNSGPLLNTSQVAQKEIELTTELSDIKVSNTTRPPLNSSQTLKIPVNIRPELSELKASNSSRPPSNYSEGVTIPVELEELPELKGSNNSGPLSNTSPDAQKEIELLTENSVLKFPNSSKHSSNSNQTARQPVDVPVELSELKPSNSSSPQSNSSEGLKVSVAVPVGIQDLKASSNTKVPPHNSTQTAEVDATLTSNINHSTDDQLAAVNQESSKLIKDPSLTVEEISNNETTSLSLSSQSDIVGEKQNDSKPFKNQSPDEASTADASIENASLPLDMNTVKKVEAQKPGSHVIELISGGLPIDETKFNALPQAQVIVEKVQSYSSPHGLSQVIEINNTNSTDNIQATGQIVVEKVESSISKQRPNQVIDLSNTDLVGLSETSNAMSQGLIAVEKIKASHPLKDSSHVIDITNADLPHASLIPFDASSVSKGEKVVIQESRPDSKTPEKHSVTGLVVEQMGSLSSPVFVSNAIEFSRPTPKSPSKKKTYRPGKQQFNPFEFSDSDEDFVSGSDEFTKDSKVKRPTYSSKKKQTQKKQVKNSAEFDYSDEEAESAEEVKPSKHSTKKQHSKKQKEVDSLEGDSVEDKNSESSEEDAVSAETTQASDEDAIKPSHQKKKAKKKKPMQTHSGESDEENDFLISEENDVSADVSEQSGEYSSKPKRPHNHRQDNMKKNHKASKKPVKTFFDESVEFSDDAKSSSNSAQSSEEVVVKANSHKHQRNPKKKKVNQVMNVNESDESSEVLKKKPMIPIALTFQNNAIKVKSPPKANSGKQASVAFLGQPADMSLENFQNNVVKVNSPAAVRPAKQAVVQFLGQPVDITFDTSQSNAVKVNSPAKPNAVKEVTVESQGNPIYLLPQYVPSNAVKVNSSEQNLKASGNVIEIQSPSAALSYINNLSESSPGTLSAVSTQPSDKQLSEHTNLSVSILSVASVRKEDPVNSTINRPIVGAHNPETGHPIEVLTGYNVNNVQCIHDGLYFLPHPSDCQKYFICAYRHLHLHSCGSSLTWSYKREQCELLSEARCFSRETKVASVKPEKVNKPTRDESSVSSVAVTKRAESSTPMPPLRTTEIAEETEQQSNRLPRCPTFIQVYLPNMDDCNKYYICILGQPVLTSCPDNLLWDARGEFCGKESEVTCVGK